MGNYRNYMISEASQGYIVVMPNYEGLDNPNRNQHYFNRDGEARTMLSAAKATILGASQVSLPIKAGALFFGGYSQGGHAAFSAADYADTYAPDLKVAGVFGHGPTTDITEFLKNNPNLAAYFVASYSEYYPAIKPETMLEKEWIGYLDRARKICVDEGFGVNSTSVARVFADPFEKALQNNTIAKDFPEIDAVFKENNAGTSYTQIPTMIVQGLADPIVTPKAQDAFVDQLCARGVSVDLKEYKGVHHFVTRQVSFKDTNAWIDAITQGKSINNSCVGR
jgi:predicted esterase